MVDAAAPPVGRAALRRRWHALRDPAGAVPALSARVARFAAGRNGPPLTFAQFAATPAWTFDPSLDRDRLADIVGLLAVRPHLAASLDGSTWRRLAGRIGEALMDRVLDDPADDAAPSGPAPAPAPELAPASLDPAEIRGRGHAILADAQAGSPEARLSGERAWRLYRDGGAAA